MSTSTRGTGTSGNVPSFSRRFVAMGPGRAPARSAGAARIRPFSGSCSRSYRCGRARTNGVIVVEARRTRETGPRAEAKRNRGQTPAARSTPGRTKALRIIGGVTPFYGTARRGDLGRALAGPPLHRDRGTSSCASEEGRRSAVTGASEGERSVDSTGRRRPRRTTEPKHPKRVGRRENAPRIRGSPQGPSARIAERSVGARRRGVVGRSWSHASLVDDLLRSS